MKSPPNPQQKRSIQSETVPLFNLHQNDGHRSSTASLSSILDKYSIGWIDVTIISFNNTVNNLVFKSWFVFAAFVDIEYSLNFYELSWSLAIQQFAAIPTLFIVPYLNKYKCNWLCLWLQLLGSLCIILNSILSGTKFNVFFVSILRVFLLQNFWTVGNSICYHFIQESPNEKAWRKNTATTIFMGSWTYSTILFLITGVLIDKYGFRMTMFLCAILNIISTIIMFYRLPAISLRDFIEIEHMAQSRDADSTENNEDYERSGTSMSALMGDFGILCKDMLFMLIMFNTLTCVTNWGMYYGSFGLWLQQLFELNAQHLGLYVTISEAIAEAIALCAIPILSRYVANTKLCIIGGILETSSVVMLNVLLWNNGEILRDYVLRLGLESMEWLSIGIVLTCLFCFYMGHEFLYISLMVNIDIVPKKQHNTGVALYGVFDFTGAVIGQTFVTYVFAKRGMIAMAPYMLIVECISISCLCAMNIILYKKKANKELDDILAETESVNVDGEIVGENQ